MAEQQTPQTFLGMPMSWDWDPQRILRNMWNPDDERVFPPKVFGIGWDVNGHALLKQFGVLPGGNGGPPSVDDVRSAAKDAASSIRKEI